MHACVSVCRNFEKFLIDFTTTRGSDGVVIGRYPSAINPFDLEQRIIPYLNKITHATDEDTERTRAAHIHHIHEL
jgi:hypothetical protein